MPVMPPDMIVLPPLLGRTDEVALSELDLRREQARAWMREQGIIGIDEIPAQRVEYKGANKRR